MDRIIITGPKSSGKSNIGARLAKLLGITFYDLDEVLESIFEEQEGNRLSFREIYRRKGEKQFRELELQAAQRMSKISNILLSTGGSTFTVESLREILTPGSYIILLTNTPQTLWHRTSRKGIPSYLENSENPKEEFYQRVIRVTDTVKPLAQMVLDTEELSIEEVAQLLDVELQNRNVKLG